MLLLMMVMVMVYGDGYGVCRWYCLVISMPFVSFCCFPASCTLCILSGRPLRKTSVPRGFREYCQRVLKITVGGTVPSWRLGDSKNTVRGYRLDIPRFEESVNAKNNTETHSRSKVFDSKSGYKPYPWSPRAPVSFQKLMFVFAA